jgi:tRNA (cmo5U34)-methyltransferase
MYDDAVSEHLSRRRQERGEAVSLEEVRTAYVSRPDRADNILVLVEDQCGWLREIGFQDVDCFWKYFETCHLRWASILKDPRNLILGPPR